MPRSSGEVTDLLARWSDGESDALDRLAPVVLDELRALARAHLAGERPGHTLQPTALVNEVFIRLLGRRKVQWANRGQFFQAAIDLMRHILVDSARRHRAAKRGGNAVKVSLEGLVLAVQGTGVEMLALHEALDRLEAEDPRYRRIIEMHFYFGLTFQQIGEVLDLAPSTVKKKWSVARVRLERDLKSL